MKKKKANIGRILRGLVMFGVLIYVVSVYVREEMAAEGESVETLEEGLVIVAEESAGKRNVCDDEEGTVGKGVERESSGKKMDEGIFIEYEGFTVSYDPGRRIPNWVRYELTGEETDGPFARNGKRFRQDRDVTVEQAEDDDYRNSGWARGHMAPAADFKWSDDAMGDTFYFTNCCPQNSALNGGQWSTLEKKVRSWAVKYGEVAVVTGPIVRKNLYGTIGENRVMVPDAFFKTVMAQETPYGSQSIAFVMYNREENKNMQGCAMTVDELEAVTGYDFFSELDDGIEEQVEGRYTLRYWGL